MKEIIEKITELIEKDREGYVITTNKRVIKLLIDNRQQCCEDWGYCDSADNFDDFIGDEIINISPVCCDKSDKRFKEKLSLHEYESLHENAEFIDIETNTGTFTIAVYNAHNGYYGHDVMIQIGDSIRETFL